MCISWEKTQGDFQINNPDHWRGVSQQTELIHHNSQEITITVTADCNPFVGHLLPGAATIALGF